MNQLIINQISIEKNKYLISWKTKKQNASICNQDLEIAYDFLLTDDYIFPINILLSLLLPILTIDDNYIRIESQRIIPDTLLEYWTKRLTLLHKKNVMIEMPPFHDNNSEYSYDEKNNYLSKSSFGLFFGGGVESLFALSKMYHKKPILISIVGERWMNNDRSNYSIKRNLENELVKDYNLHIQRITTNIRIILNSKDSFMNKWATGFVFYFLALPIANHFNIELIFKSSEMEEALNFTDYDLSLNPRMIPNISIPQDNFPLIIPAYNGYSKIQMFDELSKTEFIKYLYSCLRNTQKRWCGKCGKCIRISKYCDILKFEKSKIEMDEGIKGKREKSPISKNYWILMDNLYSSKKSLLKKFF